MACVSSFATTCAAPPAVRQIHRLAAALALGLAASVASAQGQEAASEAQNRRCLNCHGQQRIAVMSAAERAGMVSSPPTEPRADPSRLYFDQEQFAHSVHARLACADCHPGPADLPHPPKLPPPRCDGCHAAQAELYQRGIHAEVLA
jgi:hypothetical protein